MKLGNVSLIQCDFSAAARAFIGKIDILHIDGTHNYEAVKRDFEEWKKFVVPAGVILMHDTISYLHHVGKFFEEIDGWFKLERVESEGLGILTRSEELHKNIKERWF